MNKKFAEVFSGYGMTITGDYGYGLIRGYETNVVVRMMNQAAPLLIHISCYTTSDQKRAIEQTLRAAGLKFFRFVFTAFGISISLNDLTANKLIKRIPDLLNQIFDILAANGALGNRYCPVCGNEMHSETQKKAVVDGLSLYVDNDCILNLNKTIDAENQDFEKAPNNYFKGFMGALLGGFIGMVIAIILYMIGFVSAISALVAVIIGVYFYKKFGGKPNPVMIIIVALTTLVCMAGSVFTVYLLAAVAAAQEANLTISGIEAFRLLMQDPEFSRLFVSDLGLSLLFSVLGIGYQIFVLSKAIKRRKAIQQNEK